MTTPQSEAARRAAVEISEFEEDPKAPCPACGKNQTYCSCTIDAMRAAIISKHFPTTEARAALADALEPFLEVVAWAKRNRCDLTKDVDMIQRDLSRTGKFGGHLGVQGRDFIALVAAWEALRTLPAAQPTGMEDSREALHRAARAVAKIENGERYEGFESVHLETAERIIAAWQASRLSSQQAEGWVLVPREPTSEMINSGLEALDGDRADIEAAYRAMLSAAPSAPTGEKA